MNKTKFDEDGNKDNDIDYQMQINENDEEKKLYNKEEKLYNLQSDYNTIEKRSTNSEMEFKKA